MIRTIIAVCYSAFCCWLALVILIISSKSANWILLTLAKRIWSKFMMKWIICADFEVTISPKAQELFDSDHGAVLMSNHVSYIDITAAFVATPTPIVFLAKASLRRVPFLGSANERVGTVFVKQGDIKSAKKAISTLVKTVESGRSVLVFPEGSRSNDGKLARFKKGGFHLATQSGAPVVPMYIDGVFEILPVGSWRLKWPKRPVTVKFGDPLYSKNVEELRQLTFDSITQLSR